MKKILFLLIAMFVSCNCVFADDFKTYYDNGQNFLNSSQYSYYQTCNLHTNYSIYKKIYILKIVLKHTSISKFSYLLSFV